MELEEDEEIEEEIEEEIVDAAEEAKKKKKPQSNTEKRQQEKLKKGGPCEQGFDWDKRPREEFVRPCQKCGKQPKKGGFQCKGGTTLLFALMHAWWLRLLYCCTDGVFAGSHWMCEPCIDKISL